MIDIHSIVMGDVVLFVGKIIPCDGNGIVVSGHNVRCDNSGATGKSYLVIAVGPKKFKGRSIMGASFIPLTFMSLLLRQ
jgi:magnesium-transporting ATPase (P-type)